MLKVIVADDEIRICKLIINLINWEELGMEIVGVASDGIEALRLIEQEQPDLVITDIRMPGSDGLELIEKAKKLNAELEFIIISGYEEFAYAQRAMEFGVKDYLCKPINKDSLLKALGRAQEAIARKEQQSNLEKEYQVIKQDVEKIRASILKNLLFGRGEEEKAAALAELTQSPYFHFREGSFRVIAFKIDGRNLESKKLEEFLGKLAETLRLALTELAYEAELIQQESSLYVLVNYRPEIREQLEAVLKRILNETKVSFLPFGLMLTIGLGEEVAGLDGLVAAVLSAQKAIDDRIIKGTGRLIEAARDDQGRTYSEDRFCEFTKEFTKAVELLAPEEINEVIRTFKEDLIREKVSGSEIKRLVREIGNTYYVTLRNNKIKLAEGAAEQKQLEKLIENCSALDLLFQELGRHFAASITRLVAERTQQNLGQIRQAKLYIEANYMKNLTLEELGSYLGFNPSYFSSLFKKETGSSFLEYLAKVRIEKAKELLKEPGLRIQDVALMVGYNDVKYFTKLFIKHTGMKPTEFRKLFA